MLLLVGAQGLLMLKQAMQLLLLNKLVYHKELTWHVTMKKAHGEMWGQIPMQ